MHTADEKDGHAHDGCEGQARKRCLCKCATHRIKEFDDEANGSVVFLLVDAIIPIFRTPPHCDITRAVFVVHLVCEREVRTGACSTYARDGYSSFLIPM